MFNVFDLIKTSTLERSQEKKKERKTFKIRF